MDGLKICILMLLCGLAANTYAQSDVFRGSIGLNANISTCGLGGNVYWNFRPAWSVRAGYDRLSLDLKFNFNQDNMKLDADIRCITSGVSVGVDYQFFSFMYATTGLGLFRFKPKGRVVPVSELAFGDIALSPEIIGNAVVRVKNGAAVSPYIGLGFGRLTPRSNVSFALEMGTYYMGSPQLVIDASGMLEPNADPQHAALLSKQISQYRFYPVVKFSVGVKIFTFSKKSGR